MAGLENTNLRWRVLLGFASPDDRDWPLVRAAQLRAFDKHFRFPLLISPIAALLVIVQLWGAAPPALLLSWFMLQLISASFIYGALARRRDHAKGAPRSAVNRLVIQMTLAGIVWAIPLFSFAPYGNATQHIGYAAIALAIIGAAPAMCAAVPAAGIVLVTIVGSSLAFMLHSVGLDLLAIAALAYAACNVYALFHHGRSLLARLYDVIKHDRQNAVVGLLMGEREGESSSWIWQIDGRKCVVDPSHRFCEATGLDPAGLEGRPLLRLLAGPGWDTGDVGDDVRDFIARLQRGETFNELVLRVPIGTRMRFWKISGAPRIENGRAVTGYRGVIADVTESEASQRNIHRMAHFDALTGLANRTHFNELLHSRIAQASERGEIAACLMIDLDRFKAVNDTLGHPVGDRLLEMVAERLKSTLGKGDKCGRLGGDEFAMVLATVSSSTALDERARNIIRHLSQPYRVGDHQLHIGASIGSAIFPKDGRSAPTLLRNADLALYKAKESGRGVHAAFDPTLLRKAEHRRAVELALRSALANREFRLVYQPVYTLGSGAVAGYEALLRWDNETVGQVPPDRFLPIAEETRIIDPIGEWVVRTACAEAATWPDHMRLAINLSAGQLRNPRLADSILAALNGAGMSPDRLEIETTEAVLRKENETAFRTFDRLRKAGVTIALDDFGTGYSTLSLIGQTRFNSIKIDRDFIKTAEEGSEAGVAVIRAVIAMADSLGIATIIEGVETERQFALANQLGCRQVQGYFVSRPMSPEDLREGLSKRRDSAAA